MWWGRGVAQEGSGREAGRARRVGGLRGVGGKLGGLRGVGGEGVVKRKGRGRTESSGKSSDRMGVGE